MVDGAVVGDHGTQNNLYRYELEPTIDIDTIFRNRDVRDALVAYAASCGDPAHRQDAIDAIRMCRTGDHTDWGEDQQRMDPLVRNPGRAAADTEVEWLGGTVLLSDCRGVQVGNYEHQSNTFSIMLTPTVAAHDLFARTPTLAGLLVDYAVAADGVTHRSVQNELAESVCEVAGTGLDLPDGSRVYEPPVMVEGGMGLAVGRDMRQIDTSEVVAALSAAVENTLAAVPDEVVTAVAENVDRFAVDPDEVAFTPTAELRQVRCRHGNILPGGRGHLRGRVRATGSSSDLSNRPRHPHPPSWCTNRGPVPDSFGPPQPGLPRSPSVRPAHRSDDQSQPLRRKNR
jgi:hypothetical protein